MSTNSANQKNAFAERLNRISAGQQFEHPDILGHQTHKAYKRKFGDTPKKPRRSLGDKLMIVIAFFAGIFSVLLGRLAYFYLSQRTDMPESFYELGGRGMLLAALIMALTFIVIFQLMTRARLQSLLIGCLLMHFGEAAVAQSEPQLYAQIFSPGYVAAVASASVSKPAS